MSKYPNRKAINILKKEIAAYNENNDYNARFHLILAGIALSQLDGEDVINIILENSYGFTDSFDEERVEEYLKNRLIHETDSNLRKKIKETIENFHQ